MGVVLKDPVPPDGDWVNHVLDIMSAIGVGDEEEIFASFKYNDDKVRELLFKEYIILSNPDDMARFNDFQEGKKLDDDDDDGEGEDGDSDYVEAVDMFRSESE